jgi:hypothetical protein
MQTCVTQHPPHTVYLSFGNLMGPWHVQVGLKEWSEALEAKIGGRVSPMIYLPGVCACAD